MSDDKAQLVGDGNEDQYYPQHAPPVYQAPSPPVQIQPGPEQPYVAHVHQYDAQPMQNPPNDYLVHSILACIFCCWPLGLVAIIKALDVRDAVLVGDRVRAERSSRIAKKFSIAALMGGIAIIALVVMNVTMVFVNK
ncbi:proline-rich transmembrane protein 1-like isoform X1 [Ptychodera flava]|uniref:proline-rich transmembrane protein 1-like isoform X1 n=1 Tax=Ptychodera flava TaxID=63121 RepID=UPI003969EAAB